MHQGGEGGGQIALVSAVDQAGFACVLFVHRMELFL